MKRRSTYIDTKIFSISFFPGFQLNRKVIFYFFIFLLIFIYSSIFTIWFPHFYSIILISEHFHYPFLKDHWGEFSLINLSGMR